MLRRANTRKKRTAGPMGRSRRGETVSAPSHNNDRDAFEFQDDDDVGSVLGNIRMPMDLSEMVNAVKSPQSRPTTKKKRSESKKMHNSAPHPLAEALERQGGPVPKRRQQQQHVTRGPLNSEATFQGNIPRKGNVQRNSRLSSLDGNTNGAHRSSRGMNHARRTSPGNNKAHPHDRPRPRTSTGTRSKTSQDYFSRATNGFRERSLTKDREVFDLCEDDDDDEHHDPGNDTTITEHSEDEVLAQSASLSVRKRKPRAKPFSASSKESPLAKSSTAEGSPAKSSSSGTATESSAATHTSSTTDSSKGCDQGSSDEEELEVLRSPKKPRDSSRRAPNSSRVSSDVAYGGSDLYSGFGDESEQDETGVSICRTLDGISYETYGGGTASSLAHKPAKKTLAKRERKATPLSSDSRGSSSANSSMPNERACGVKLSKVNARKPTKRRKQTGKTITVGVSIPSFSNPRPDDDSIHSCDSEELSWGSTQRRRQNASNYSGGVQKNPYAAPVPNRRESHPRTAKTKARKPQGEDLVDTDEEDDTALVNLGTRRLKKPTRKKKDAIRIAIGKKVFTSQCAIRYIRNTKGGAILLSACFNGEKVEHQINLDDESVLETKYFLSKDDDDQDGATISIDFDESEQMTFLALRVEPNEKNELSKYSNSYQPEKSDGADRRRYIAIEFRSDQEFLDLLRELKKDESLGAFVCDSTSLLKAAEAEVYGKALFQAARKERADRESNVGSPRVRRKRRKKRGSKNSNEVLLVFPFGADEDKIGKVAEVLTEASNTNAVKCDEDIAVEGSAILKSADEEAMASLSERADNIDEKGDDDKDESAGKAKSRAHFLTIRDEDYDRLQPGEFLNDTLIDFWFQWIWRKDRHVNGDVHFFTSHFYTALAKGGPEAVTSWTAKKNIDVFTKKYIFIPVNLSLHWSLCVVVNPGAILNEVEGYGPSCDDTMDDELVPCILFFDSLKAHKKNVITNKVKKWLNSEWQRLEKPKTEKAEDAVKPFHKGTMEVFTPRVPYQDNSWDCGVFVCRYGYGLFRLREYSVTYRDRIEGFRTFITDNEEFDFDREDIVRIRREMATLLDNLSALYKEWKKANDEAEEEAEEDSKKPAARQLLLEDDKVSHTEVSKSTTTKPLTEQAEGLSAADDGASAKSKETGTANKPSDPSPQLAEAEVKDAPTNESNDVEMSDGDQASFSTQPENAEGVVDMDVDMDNESSEEAIAMDIENADNAMSVDENADMHDEATTVAFPIAPVKQEEDQYGGGEVLAPLQVKHDEDIGEAESDGHSDDKDESDYFPVTDI